MACIIYPSLSIDIHTANLATDGTGAQSQEHLEKLIERTYRCSWRPWSHELGDVLGGRIWASLEMNLVTEIELNSGLHLEAVIERFQDAFGGWYRATQICTWKPRSSLTQRCTCLPWLSWCGYALGGWDQVTQRCTWRWCSSRFRDASGGRDWVTQRCTWRARSSGLRDALGGRDLVSLEMKLKADIL